MREIVEKIMADPRYRKNIEYGEPRSGHPEGKVKYHIAELEEKLEKLASHGISEEGYWKLKFLIHVHDTFKADAIPNTPILVQIVMHHWRRCLLLNSSMTKICSI